MKLSREPFFSYLAVRVLGPRLARRVFGSSLPGERLLEIGREELSGIVGVMPDALCWPPPLEQVQGLQREFTKTIEHGVSPVFFLGEGYPERLNVLPDPPACLFIKGHFLASMPCVAIVGARRPTVYGLEVANRLAKDLALAGVAVVSGLARGVDGAAHVGALDAEGKTWAVLGSGLDCVYPKEHERLAERILNEYGALISEYPLGFSPRKEHFPKRNRIIAALADGLVVVEAGEKSGTLITVGFALDLGREVMAVPGSVFSERSKGTHALIRQGAQLVQNATEVLEALEFRKVLPGIPADKKQSPTTTKGLLNDQAGLLDLLGPYPEHIDALRARSGLPIEELSVALAELEVQGVARSLPGKYYQKI
jgi:DNA processing protein